MTVLLTITPMNPPQPPAQVEVEGEGLDGTLDNVERMCTILDNPLWNNGQKYIVEVHHNGAFLLARMLNGVLTCTRPQPSSATTVSPP